MRHTGRSSIEDRPCNHWQPCGPVQPLQGCPAFQHFAIYLGHSVSRSALARGERQRVAAQIKRKVLWIQHHGEISADGGGLRQPDIRFAIMQQRRCQEGQQRPGHRAQAHRVYLVAVRLVPCLTCMGEKISRACARNGNGQQYRCKPPSHGGLLLSSGAVGLPSPLGLGAVPITSRIGRRWPQWPRALNRPKWTGTGYTPALRSSHTEIQCKPNTGFPTWTDQSARSQGHGPATGPCTIRPMAPQPEKRFAPAPGPC